MKPALMITGLCAVIPVLWGCGRHEEPVPASRFAVSSGGQALPVSLGPESRDKGILAAAASNEPPPKTAAAPVPVDDSSAQAIVETYVAVMNAHQFAQLPDIVVAEQQDAARQMAAVVQPFIDAERNLKQKLDEHFPGHAIQLGSLKLAMGSLSALKYQVISVEVVSDTEATAKIRKEGPNADEQQVKVHQADGVWRIEDPQIPPPDQREAILSTMGPMLANLTQVLQSVAAKLDAGELADEAAVNEALAQAQSGQARSTQTPGGPPTEADQPPAPVPAPEAAGEPAAATPSKPPERQREAVDDVYSGPGMLRAR